MKKIESQANVGQHLGVQLLIIGISKNEDGDVWRKKSFINLMNIINPEIQMIQKTESR